MSSDWIETVCLMIVRPLVRSNESRSSYDYQIYLNHCEQNEHFHYDELFGYGKYPRAKLLPEDFHKSWLQIISAVDDHDDDHDARSPSSSSSSLLADVGQRKLQNIPMIKQSNLLANLDTETDNPDPVLALRICAHRCLFQELGVILAEPKNFQCDSLDERPGKVRSNPGLFRTMLETFKPPIKIKQSSMFEWWNWLTPTTVGRSPRFDTMYYLVILDPPPSPSSSSSSSSFSNGYWTTLDHEPTMPPSDLYEWKCLQRFHRFNDLKTVLQNQDYWNIPLERWLPYVQLFQDGSISFLPGDQSYPKEPPSLVPKNPPRMYDKQTVEMQTKQRKFPTISLNRIEHRGFTCKIVARQSGGGGGAQSKQQQHYHCPYDPHHDHDHVHDLDHLRTKL